MVNVIDAVSPVVVWVPSVQSHDTMVPSGSVDAVPSRATVKGVVPDVGDADASAVGASFRGSSAALVSVVVVDCAREFPATAARRNTARARTMRRRVRRCMVAMVCVLVGYVQVPADINQAKFW